jgi:hypothetical protein
MDIVGDDPQTLVGDGERLGHRLDGGADAHEQRGMVGNAAGNHVGNMCLFALEFSFARKVILVLHAAAQGSTTMVTAQQIFFAQLIDIAPDGLRRYIEQSGQLLDRHEAVFADQLQNLVMTG